MNSLYRNFDDLSKNQMIVWIHSDILFRYFIFKQREHRVIRTVNLFSSI